MDHRGSVIPPPWAVGLEYAFTVWGQFVCIINTIIGVRIIFYRRRVGQNFRWFNSLILLALICYFVSFIPFYFTTQTRASHGDALEKAVRIYELDRWFNGFFTTGALFYLLTMQGRFQVIRKVKHYSAYWDYGFVLVTTGLWLITMYYSAFIRASPLLHTLAGALFAIYVTLCANTLSLIFILTLYKAKQQTGRTNKAAFYRVARALVIICTLSWICAVLGIMALLGFQNNETIRPLLFRISFGIGGPMELGGVLLFIYEVRNLVLSPLPQMAPTDKNERPAGNQVQDAMAGGGMGPAGGMGGKRPSLVDMKLLKVLQKKLPAVQDAQDAQAEEGSMATVGVMSESEVTPMKTSQSHEHLLRKSSSMDDMMRGSKATLAETLPRKSTGSPAPPVAHPPRAEFSLNIRGKPSRDFTVSIFSQTGSLRGPSGGVNMVGPMGSITSESSSIVSGGNVPTTPYSSFTSQTSSAATGSRTGSEVGPAQSITAGPMPATPNTSFATNSTAATTSPDHHYTQGVPTPNTSMISTTESFAIQLPRTPMTSFTSTATTSGIHYPAAPHQSFASATTTSSVYMPNIPQTPYQSFASAEPTTSYTSPYSRNQSIASVMSVGPGIPDTPANSFASAAYAAQSPGAPKKSNLKKNGRAGPSSPRPQGQQGQQQGQGQGEGQGEGVLGKLKEKMRVRWVNVVT
ncbi:hypothetical protein HK097_002984 [Rhizophlyctis rosea]|uniref:Uncharacterized protein n=1 Tax=Rhizophlyctis rosea TaxID=64517 RepID=A0AAD5SG65_9FUNG|nr:hypothetical protein HK097_002984 [Rhizophlyctis rosea]